MIDVKMLKEKSITYIDCSLGRLPMVMTYGVISQYCASKKLELEQFTNLLVNSPTTLINFFFTSVKKGYEFKGEEFKISFKDFETLLVSSDIGIIMKEITKTFPQEKEGEEVNSDEKNVVSQ